MFCFLEAIVYYFSFKVNDEALCQSNQVDRRTFYISNQTQPKAAHGRMYLLEPAIEKTCKLNHFQLYCNHLIYALVQT